MRPEFFKELYKHMNKNHDIFALTGDLGYGGFDKIRKDFPDRFINCGASEQAMLDIAVGLALKGKTVFVYTISSFFLRAMETVSIYLSHEQIPVLMVGSGRDQDYEIDGFTHDADTVQEVLGDMNIDSYYPEDKKQISFIVEKMIEKKKPAFISLRRG